MSKTKQAPKAQAATPAKAKPTKADKPKGPVPDFTRKVVTPRTSADVINHMRNAAGTRFNTDLPVAVVWTQDVGKEGITPRFFVSHVVRLEPAKRMIEGRGVLPLSVPQFLELVVDGMLREFPDARNELANHLTDAHARGSFGMFVKDEADFIQDLTTADFYTITLPLEGVPADLKALMVSCHHHRVNTAQSIIGYDNSQLTAFEQDNKNHSRYLAANVNRLVRIPNNVKWDRAMTTAMKTIGGYKAPVSKKASLATA